VRGEVDNRRAPRIDIEVSCTLRRRNGSPIVAQTLNLGAGGMLVASIRPLAVDEELDFEIDTLQTPVSGHARVLRQQLHDTYALRFERLPDDAADCLRTLASGDAPTGPTLH